MSLSAVATEHFVGVKVPDVYFKSDKQNTDIVYFEVRAADPERRLQREERNLQLHPPHARRPE